MGQAYYSDETIAGWRNNHKVDVAGLELRCKRR